MVVNNINYNMNKADGLPLKMVKSKANLRNIKIVAEQDDMFSKCVLNKRMK